MDALPKESNLRTDWIKAKDSYSEPSLSLVYR